MVKDHTNKETTMNEGTAIALSTERVTDANVNRLARNRTRSLSVEQLVEAFAVTDHDNSDGIPQVRGWLMDELEDRNPRAFEAWLATDDMTTADLRRCFGVQEG